MKIAFVTEMRFTGKIPEEHNNLRTMEAWILGLDAEHYHFQDINLIPDDTDLVIMPMSKEQVDDFCYAFQNLVEEGFNVGFLQEGSWNLIEDYSPYTQEEIINCIKEADVVFVHNESDKPFFKSITKSPVIRMKTCMDVKKHLSKKPLEEKKDKILIGGTFCKWYNGYGSYLAVKDTGHELVIPGMGRMKDNEEKYLKELGIEVQEFKPLDDFLDSLEDFKLAIHLMPTNAAGSFYLNCATKGVPFIGNLQNSIATQLSPGSVVEPNNILEAKDIAKSILNDELVYSYLQNRAYEMAKELDYRTVCPWIKKRIREELKWD